MTLQGGLTEWGEANTAAWTFPNAGSAPTPVDPNATTYFFELTSTAPTDAAAGTELTGDGYGGGLTVNQSLFTYAQTTGVTTITNNAIVGGNPGWGAPTADWAINGFNLYDAAAGNRWFWGETASEVTAVTGAYVQFATSALVITFS